MFGLTLILLGSAVALTARLPRALGYLMGLSGLAYIVQGWVLGSEGFSANQHVRNPGRLCPHPGVDHLACCGRLADKGIVQSAYSVAIDPPPDSISGLRGYFSSSKRAGPRGHGAGRQPVADAAARLLRRGRVGLTDRDPSPVRGRHIPRAPPRARRASGVPAASTTGDACRLSAPRARGTPTSFPRVPERRRVRAKLRLDLWLREGELTRVVVEALGPEVIDVEHAHRVGRSRGSSRSACACLAPGCAPSRRPGDAGGSRWCGRAAR